MTLSRGVAIAAALVCLALAVAGCAGMPRAAEPRELAAGPTADILVALGRSLESDGDSEKAMAAYREAARRAPGRPEAALRLAKLLDRAGRFAEAEPFYASALEASPGDAGIFCDRGYSLALQGRDAEAEAALRQAIAKEPGLARAHNNLGLLLARSGRADDALSEFRKAGCPEPDAELNLAFALGQAGRWDEAKGHVAIARRLGATAPGVGEGAAEIDALIARAEASPAPSPATDADPEVLRAAGAAKAPRARR